MPPKPRPQTYFHLVTLEPDECFTCCEWRMPLVQRRAEASMISEFLILLTIQGRGMRFVGDHVARFKEGDLVLAGPYMPLAWWGDAEPTGAQAYYITSSFRENFLGEEFLSVPELAPVRQLLARAWRGINFPESVSRKVMPLMLRMAEVGGLKRLRLLLEVLEEMAAAPQAEPLVSPGFSVALSEVDAGRLRDVCRYIRESYEGPIQRKEAARVACLSEASFSRFFHKRMARTFEAYVAEIRVGQACHKLTEQDSSIAEIAFGTGFNTLSNFNQQFRRIKGMTPSAYRQLHAETVLNPASAQVRRAGISRQIL